MDPLLGRAAFALLCLTFAWIAPVPRSARAADPKLGTAAWFDVHAFEGSGGCLVVREGQRLGTGDFVLVLAAGRPAVRRRITTVVDADSAKRVFDTMGFEAVYHDPALWSRFGCWWFVKDADSPRMTGLARFDETEAQHGDDEEARHGLSDSLPLAFSGLPPSALAVGGERTAMADSELAAIGRRWAARLPKSSARGRLLRSGWRYHGSGGRELLEVFIGKPFESPADPGPPIDSVAIRRLVLHAGRLLAVDSLFRASGVEEHVDLEPPQLDDENWCRTSEETIGFLSFDGGASWARVSVDVGFEGINWGVSPSREGFWSRYLYTRH